MKTTSQINTVKKEFLILSFMFSLLFYLTSCKKDDIEVPSKVSTGASERQIKSNHDDVSKGNAEKVNQLKFIPPNANQGKIAADVLIKIDHQAARSKAPDYVVTVFSNGKVVFEGRRNVTFIGPKEMKIDKSTVEELKRLFTEANFSGIEDALPYIADIPTVYTTYNGPDPVGDVINTLKDYNDGIPLELIALRIKTESILNISHLVNGHDSAGSLDIAIK